MKLSFFSLTLALLISISAFSQISHHDHPSTHGMLVVGKENIYISHLPMFHTPHDYQVIFHVELDAAAKAAYITSLGQANETVYTMVPESFVLPEMAQNQRPFQAEIYKGHFERGGELIASHVTVRIQKVLYFKKFVPGETKPQQMQSLLFGTKTEPFLAHLITSKPDFDQVVALAPVAEGSPLGTTPQSLTVKIEAQANTEPFINGQKPSLRPTGSASPLPVEILQSLYLETGDLSF